MKNLRHPGIPIIYDTEEDENCYYLVEEYIQGESLSAFVQNQDNISQETVITIGIQLCEILAYLHQQKPRPILYLDMKPEHIILCGKQLKLIDFGIATMAGNSYQSCGTRGFAAPEQYTGSTCGMQTDVYGIGAILYYMLARQVLPPPGKMPIPFPRHCSLFFKKIVLTAVAPEADSRYETVIQLERELQKLNSNRKGKQPIVHLLNRIIVVGSQKRAGATHVSIGLACWLNHQGRPALYEPREENPLPHLLAFKKGFVREGGIYRYREFQGCKEADLVGWSEEEAVLVQDYGGNIMAAAENELAQMVILVMGSRAWEIDQSMRAYDQLSGEENLQLICNYQDNVMAKQYAEIFRRKVFSYPLDKDPFLITREKHRLFRQMFQERRGET